MLIGHWGLAQLARAARRDGSIAWLAVAAYLPDIVRIGIGLAFGHVATELASHSLPAVALLALAVAIAWLLRGGRPAAAALLALLCLLHWPADVFTGCKPTWPGGPWLGFTSYRHPHRDLAVEILLAVAGWWMLRRAARVPRRPFVQRPLFLALVLCAQFAFLAMLYYDSTFRIGEREWQWKPERGLAPERVTLEIFPCRAPVPAASENP